MARKVQPKKKVDVVAVTLKLLARATRESVRAVGYLGKAAETPIELPILKTCKFTVGAKKYSAKLTTYQADKILESARRGGDVTAVLGSLLSTLTDQVAGSANALLGKLTDPARPPKKGKTAAAVAIVLGCCTFVGGQLPKLSQSQCNHYNPTSWDPTSPDCTRVGEP
jgi:hypothetical protein